MYSITTNGIELPTLQEILNYWTEQLKSIYGENINLNQNTPDGQLLNILAQQQIELNQILTYIYNSFDPQVAEGKALDRDVAYNGIQRNAGSYTIVPITIVCNQATTLQGLDNNYNDPQGTGFTVSDSSGNNYILISTTTLQAGNSILEFRAQDIGVIKPTLNTINIISTPQLGVVSVNNPSAPVQIGVDEESDYDLRNRFNNSFALGGVGTFENIVSALYSLEGVLSVSGENNVKNTTSAAGTPAHSVWLIIQGGDNDDIAQAIKSTISSGCGMRGDVEVGISNPFGDTDIYKFDRPTIEQLHIMFEITRKTNTAVIDENYLKEQLIQNLTFKINDLIDASQIDNILTSINNNLVYTNIEVSNDGNNYYDFIRNTNINYIFSLSTENINITINS